MCEGTVLPHCAHLFSCGACQRLAALRVRNRILEVLRFGTPMFSERKRKHDFAERQRWNVKTLKGIKAFERLERGKFANHTLHRFNFSLSNTLQSAFAVPASPVVSSLAALQMRPSSRSQCG